MQSVAVRKGLLHDRLINGMTMSLRGRDFISVDALSPEELWHVLEYATELKRRAKAGERPSLLAGKVLAMIFEKPSLRTRVTFEVGMWELGGHAIYLAPQDIQLGTRESVADIARNLERWAAGVMARVSEHGSIEQLAQHAAVPVINGLSNREHPCQTLADLLTIHERFGRLEGVRVAWIGDGNNVCHSLLLGAAKVGAHVTIAAPVGYEPDGAILTRAREIAARSGSRIGIGTDPREAARGADVIYTDVWTSMGSEADRAERLDVFAKFRVDARLVSEAAGNAVVMHCLPAHRGEEITDEVLDGPQSIVFNQAENRLHAQKALLALVL